MTERNGIDPSSQIRRAQVPCSGIYVPRHLGIGCGLVHSLDYVVMLQVTFNLESGVQATPTVVWEQLRERGIRSDRDMPELVTWQEVHESFARLVESGLFARESL